MEEEKKDHEQKMRKMESDMEQVFEIKVKEKMQKLADSESDVRNRKAGVNWMPQSHNLTYLQLQRRHEQTVKAFEQQRQELEEKRALFEKERAAFEMVTREMEDMRRAGTLETSSRE